MVCIEDTGTERPILLDQGVQEKQRPVAVYYLLSVAGVQGPGNQSTSTFSPFSSQVAKFYTTWGS